MQAEMDNAKLDEANLNRASLQTNRPCGVSAVVPAFVGAQVWKPDSPGGQLQEADFTGAT